MLQQRIAQDIETGRTPFMVVATAGTTAAGVIDPLDAIADICEAHNLWYHVDAAWGGSAVLSPKLRTHLRGIERADSVTWDAHKWLSVPLGAGMFFCKHRTAVGRTFAVDASYMPSETEQAIDPFVTSIQWSRRFIGLKVFMALATLGEPELVRIIETQAQMGALLRDKLSDAGWTIVNSTPLPVICFSHERFDGNIVLLDRFLQGIYERARVWISKVSLANGAHALRACITSFRTDEQDLDVLIDELNVGLHEL
jgi:glutamate/tyrosine decarboxylase-like PLP-dependent enzyme